MKEAIDHTRQMLMDTEERKARRQELLEKNRIFTLANLLSLIRLLLLPFVLACLLANRSDYDLLALGLIFVAGITDYLDGVAARRRDEVSQLGKIIDPVADKLFIGALGLILVLLRNLPAWFVAIYLFRDFMILTIGYLLFLNRDIVVSSNLLGKLTTVVLLTIMVAYTVRLEEVGLPLVYVGTLLVLASGLVYARNFIVFTHRLRAAASGTEAEVGPLN